jgi:hypothetical protein
VKGSSERAAGARTIVAPAARVLSLARPAQRGRYTAPEVSMLRTTGTLLAAIVLFQLLGCSVAGVIATHDPDRKLHDAMELFDHQGRPLPAEPLIVEAIDQYKASSDSIGLANAYRVHGLFFRSRILGQPNYAARYETEGFLDHSATYATRYERSMDYLRMAAELLKDSDRADLLSNVYFHLGDVSLLRADRESACSYFDQSLAAQAQFRASNPDTSVELPAGSHSFEEALHNKKRYAGCE